MLKDADSNAMPTKYAQNKRHGMYEGTLSMMNFAPERCSAPKTAKGTAKHKLLKATILSRPPARAISVFAAHSATRKSRMPTLHIETAVREISRNVARMAVCMWMPGVSSRALCKRESPFWVQKRSEVYTHANGALLELRRGHPPITSGVRRAFPCRVVGLPGLAPSQTPQSARREDEGEAPEPAERPECPDEEEAAGGLGDLAVMCPPHVDDGHACREQPDEQHDDVSRSPFGEHQRPVQQHHENGQRNV